MILILTDLLMRIKGSDDASRDIRTYLYACGFAKHDLHVGLISLVLEAIDAVFMVSDLAETSHLCDVEFSLQSL